jgi:hypothetical protein
MLATSLRRVTDDPAPERGTELRFVQIAATRSGIGGADLVYGLTHDGRVYELTAGGWKALPMTEVPEPENAPRSPVDSGGGAPRTRADGTPGGER